jgi:UDP-glucose 4-epimerase
MTILVTGGAGYAGSHTIVELLAAGHDVISIDNFSNGNTVVFDRLKEITGTRVVSYGGDLRDKALLRNIFDTHRIDAVIHCAGLKAVAESIEQPLRYYSNNIGGTVALCEVMQETGMRTLIFSSSATVYGTPEALPLTEESPVGNGITNPYGWTKYMIERILIDLSRSADEGWHIVLLRYFNPVGAHESGRIGEDPVAPLPANIMPYIARVAVGRLEKLKIFGNDYDTPDGTAVRDYIHVTDLARGHVVALDHADDGQKLEIYNLGTGRGVSVLGLVGAFEKASGRRILYEFADRRLGDVAACYASVEKAERLLGWKATKTIEDACQDTWRWQSENPNGYRT